MHDSKYRRHAILPLLAIALLLLFPLWLVAGAVSFTFLLWLICKLRHRQNYFLSALVAYVILLGIAIRTFVVEIYHVSSNSMERALSVGTKIMVSKITYGPTLPSSMADFPIIGALFEKKGYSGNSISLPEKARLDGLQKIARYDIAAIDLKNKDGVLVKRCLGLPGETVGFSGDRLRINGQFISAPSTVTNMYIAVGGIKDLKAVRKKLGASITRITFSDRSFKIAASLNLEERNGLLSGWGNRITLHYLPSINIRRRALSKFYKKGFKIPYRGMKIRLDSYNLNLYADLITKYENTAARLIAGKASLYEFQKDYYFFLGDNREISVDSRYWDVIPMENIIGKAYRLF